jgi:hypothetical protein
MGEIILPVFGRIRFNLDNHEKSVKDFFFKVFYDMVDLASHNWEILLSYKEGLISAMLYPSKIQHICVKSVRMRCIISSDADAGGWLVTR